MREKMKQVSDKEMEIKAKKKKKVIPLVNQSESLFLEFRSVKKRQS